MVKTLPHPGLHILLIALMAVGWSACVQQDGGLLQELNIAEKKQPNRIQPILSRSLTAKSIEQLVFQPLIAYEPSEQRHVPVLLSQMPSMRTTRRDSGVVLKRLDLSLRSDAQWTDGREVTIEDVLFTYKCIFNPHVEAAGLRRNLAFIRGAEVPTDEPGQLRLYVDTGIVWSIERACQLNILPANHYDSVGLMSDISLEDLIEGNVTDETDARLKAFADRFHLDRYSREEVMGSGPYEMRQWVTDYEIVLERKEDWWGHRYSDHRAFMANPSTIRYRFIADDQLAQQALEAQQVDVMTDVRPAKFDAMRKSRPEAYHYLTPTVPQYVFLILNHADGPLTDKEVRKALAHTVDEEAIISALLYDYGVPITGPFLPQSSWYAHDVPLYRPDTTVAWEHLSSAGWQRDAEGRCVSTGGEQLSLRLHITGSATSRQVATILKDRLSLVGINLEVITQRFNPNTVEDMQRGDFDMVLALRTFGELPVTLRSNWYTVDGAVGANYGRFSHPTVDSLIDAVEEVSEPSQIAPITKALHRQLQEEVAAIFLWAPQQRILVNKKWNPVASNRRPGYRAAHFEPISAD